MRASLDRERALHARGLVAVDRADELVRARLEVDADRGVATRDDLGLEIHAVALDVDGVRHRGRVAEPDRRLAGLGVELGLIELQPPVGRRGDLHYRTAAAAARRRLRRGGRRRRGLLAVVAAAAGEPSG